MNNNETSELPQIEKKKRHGCLTACLILMILGSVYNILYGLYTYFFNDIIQINLSWFYLVMAVAGLLNIVSLVAVFKWKKWGFWLFSITAVFVFLSRLDVGAFIVPSLLIGSTGVAFLFGALFMGDKNGWSQLD